jgi:hypothetical protein
MPSISRSVRLLAGMLVALALAVLFAGFLRERRSSPVATPSPASAPVIRDARPTTLSSQGPAAAQAHAFDTPAPTPPDAVPVVSAPAASAAVNAPPSAEVARYFEEADAVEARAKYWSDPQALARTILEQAASGKTDAFEELIRAQTSARDELARMSVPVECAEHHRRSLVVMAEGIGLLERVRSAIGSGELGALDGIQESARALEREAKAIDELGRKLRSR